MTELVSMDIVRAIKNDDRRIFEIKIRNSKWSGKRMHRPARRRRRRRAALARRPSSQPEVRSSFPDTY